MFPDMRFHFVIWTEISSSSSSSRLSRHNFRLNRRVGCEAPLVITASFPFIVQRSTCNVPRSLKYFLLNTRCKQFREIVWLKGDLIWSKCSTISGSRGIVSRSGRRRSGEDFHFRAASSDARSFSGRNGAFNRIA